MDYRSDTSAGTANTSDSIIKLDKERYQRKGYGIIMALVFTALGFIIVPNILYHWIAYLEGHTPRFINNCVLIWSHLIAYVVGNVGMYIIYTLKHPFFERYRVRQNPWPWEENPEAWALKRKQVFKNWLINATIGSSMCVVDSYFSEMQRSDLASFPTCFEFLWQIVFSMVLEDTIFYWFHRTLHNPKLYPLIHKKHHEFYTTVSISAEYAHPLEYALGNVFPVFAASKILGARMHLITVTTWLILRIGETVDGHSGYEFSWSPYRLLPFSSSSEYHNFHHSHNVGNYESFFSFWDTLCGTNKSYLKYRKEMEKENELAKMRQEYNQKHQKLE